MRKKKPKLAWLWAGILSLSILCPVAPIRAHVEVFAAAASLQPVLEKIADQYKKDKGVTLDGVFGASGQLARQIEMGAPYDLFLSADERWARYLEDKGKLEKVKPVAECPLVLWWSSDEAPPLDIVKGEKIRVAIADPDVAPFGVLAKEHLEKVGKYESLNAGGRLVIAGDVLQAALAVGSGGADAAFIPLSIAIKQKGSWTKVPMPPQRLFGGIVKDRQALEATAFYDHLFSPAAAEVFREAGFEPVRD